MNDSSIEVLYQEYSELRAFLEETEQISFLNYIDNTYKKSLLLSVASYFETLITEIILGYFKSKSSNDEKAVKFVEKKALDRQYHTLFDWGASNTNRFFAYFGDDTKREAREYIEKKGLVDEECAFITIGAERNKLVHNNYAQTRLDAYTFEDIYKLYKLGLKFVEVIQITLPNS